MWKRNPLQAMRRDQKQAQSPTLAETSHNPKLPSELPSSPIESRQVFVHSHSVTNTGRSLSPGQENSKDGRSSTTPTESSVYSQDLSAITGPQLTITDNFAHYFDPEGPSNRKPSNSPDSGSSPTEGSRLSYFTSQIPTLRRSASNLMMRSSSRQAKNTKWDEYSGEPSLNGKPGQTTPATYIDQFGNTQTDHGYLCTVSGPEKKRSIFGERTSKMGKENLTVDTNQSWKGGLGPLQDTTTGGNKNYTAVKNIPGGDSDSTLRRDMTPNTLDVSPVSPIGGSFEDAALRPNALNISHQTSGDSVSPVSTRPTAYTPWRPQQAPAEIVVTQPSPTPKRISRKPVSSQSLDSETAAQIRRDIFGETSEPTDTASADSFASQPKSPALVPYSQQLPNDLSSRFSWTTVNTATTYQQDSLPPSPPSEPVPQMPLMARGRPVPPRDSPIRMTPPRECPPTPPSAGFESPCLIVRKQRSVTNPAPGTMSSPEPGKGDKKALPLPPTILKTMSHIEALSARRDDLNVQRRNIQTVINGLMKIETASPLVIGIKERRENKRKLDEYTLLLKEVDVEAHEVGLNLSRARRKAERAQGLDNSIWVRRVTG